MWDAAGQITALVIYSPLEIVLYTARCGRHHLVTGNVGFTCLTDPRVL